MRNGFVLFFSIFLLSTCQQQDSSQEKHWTTIDQYIMGSWETEQFTGSSRFLPHTFTSALTESHFYYWDIFFIHKGLIRHQKWELMRKNLENFIFEIDSLGFIPNTTESWGFNRSQVPFFSMMVKDYYQANPLKNKQWLARAYHACVTEYNFWIRNRESGIPGLQRYYHHATHEEVSTVYDNVGPINRLKNDSSITTLEEKVNFGANFIAECESGMDFTTRFQQNIINYVPVCLNSNLYQYERNFAWFERELEMASTANWDSIAEARKQLMNTYLWDEARGAFADYNFVSRVFNPLLSYAMFYPLVYGIATPVQAKKSLANLSLLESSHGIISVEVSTPSQPYQWDHRSIWPPVQWVTYTGLANYGYNKEAQRVATKYLELITRNFIDPIPGQVVIDGQVHQRSPGHLWEKYTPGGELNDDDYPCHEMLGWAAGVFVDLRAIIQE